MGPGLRRRRNRTRRLRRRRKRGPSRTLDGGRSGRVPGGPPRPAPLVPSPAVRRHTRRVQAWCPLVELRVELWRQSVDDPSRLMGGVCRAAEVRNWVKRHHTPLAKPT